MAVDAWAVRHGIDTTAGLAPSFVVVLALYVASTLINLRLRGGAAAHPLQVWPPIHPLALWREFDTANRTLWRDDAGGRLSLAVTTLFWGAAAVLQFAVLRWATERLGLTLAGAAYLQAAVALGLIIGAWLAGRFVTLQHAPRVLLAGPLLGLLVAFGPWLESTAAATVLLIAVGLVGGLLMVPMNALLQHRGCQLLSPGRSIAVQGFNENISVLALLAAYAATVRLEVPIAPLMTAFGWCGGRRDGAARVEPAPLNAAPPSARGGTGSRAQGPQQQRAVSRFERCHRTPQHRLEVVDHALPVERECALAGAGTHHPQPREVARGVGHHVDELHGLLRARPASRCRRAGSTGPRRHGRTPPPAGRWPSPRAPRCRTSR